MSEKSENFFEDENEERKDKNKKNEFLAESVEQEFDLFNNLNDLVDQYVDLKKQEKEIQSKINETSVELKNSAKLKFINLYDKNSEKPDSFILKSESGNSITYTISEKYKSLNEERLQQVKDFLGEEFIEKSVSYTFNNEMLKKYKDVINDFIKNTNLIKQEDKKELIKSHTTNQIKKGSLNYISSYKEKSKILEVLQPEEKITISHRI